MTSTAATPTAPSKPVAPVATPVTPEVIAPSPALQIAKELLLERTAQDERFGEQNHPDGTGSEGLQNFAAAARADADRAAADETLTWWMILREEFAEASAESEPAPLRAELLQVAAVATAWVEAIDRRTAAAAAAAATDTADAAETATAAA